MSAPEHHPKQREYTYVKADNAKREDLNMSAPERLQISESMLDFLVATQNRVEVTAPAYVCADLYEQAVRERDAARAAAARMRRALIRAGFTDHGGEEWKPPLGRKPLAFEQAAERWLQEFNQVTSVAHGITDASESALQALVDQSAGLGLYDEGKRVEPPKE